MLRIGSSLRPASDLLLANKYSEGQICWSDFPFARSPYYLLLFCVLPTTILKHPQHEVQVQFQQLDE